MAKQYGRMIRAEDDGDGAGSGGVMTFVASTGGVKRDGLEIDQEAWQLDGYRGNPVVLVNHDYSQLPIGTADVGVEDGQLMARITWDSEDERAQAVRGKYERGIMRAVSVGWRDTDDGHELLDVSAVAVPGDPDALKVDQARALRAMADTLDEGDNGEDEATDATDAPADDDSEQPTRESWREIAAGMVAIFDVNEDADDAAREAAYKAHRPLYRKWDKVIPELLPAAEVAALDVEEWRGLFLEDELEVTGYRAGKVLSSRNESDLRTAADLIMKVLRSAAKDDGKADEKDDDGERGATDSTPHKPFDWASPELRRALGLPEIADHE